MRLFRICHVRYLEDLRGLGASYRDGARWNEPGFPIIYFAETPSVAMLEMAHYLPSPRCIRHEILNFVRRVRTRKHRRGSSASGFRRCISTQSRRRGHAPSPPDWATTTTARTGPSEPVMRSRKRSTKTGASSIRTMHRSV